MRTPEEQEEYLQSGRFERPAASGPIIWRVIRALVTAGILLIVTVFAIAATWLIVLPWLGRLVPREVVRSERRNRGYSIAKHRWSDGIEIRIWSNGSTDLRLRREMALADVIAHRWLPKDRAVVMGLKLLERQDSIREPVEYWVAYDFEQGDLRSCAAKDTSTLCDEIRLRGLNDGER